MNCLPVMLRVDLINHLIGMVWRLDSATLASHNLSSHRQRCWKSVRVSTLALEKLGFLLARHLAWLPLIDSHKARWNGAVLNALHAATSFCPTTAAVANQPPPPARVAHHKESRARYNW